MVGEGLANNKTLTVDVTLFKETLAEHIRRAFHKYPGQLKNVVVRVSMPALVDFEWLAAAVSASPLSAWDYVWYAPEQEILLAGFGVSDEITASGDGRFEDIREQMSGYHLEQSDTGNEFVPPLWFGGYSFDPNRRGAPWLDWPDARFILPRWQFRAGREQTVTFQTRLDEGIDIEAVVQEAVSDLTAWLTPQEQHTDAFSPFLQSTRLSPIGKDDLSQGYEQWRDAVEATAREIGNMEYRKAVLARCMEIPLESGANLALALRQLVTSYPQSVTFALRQGEQVFLGASPERLVRVMNREVHVDCLAGSIRRGDTADEDTEMGRQLLESDKDRHEHAVVVDYVVTSIADKISELDVASQPILRRLANVQHLYTPVRGQLDNGDVLQLVERLHPTPAVAGDPRPTALSVIQKREQTVRGWYAGAVGFVSASGDGEFVVALRSGLLEPGRGYLFAGAGIMAESTPEKEWQETKLKLRPMQTALQHSHIGGKTDG
ncbi:isochorismate synthase MenF [Alicyclobacillus sp. SO9]|uniref:isochorismate synthase n=1 Tax=Alicyclobacillus sp. SO9 TaxID=2665646 RepID=UPI0018E85E1D|nr:isochorismate synthase [Alicyclobacillus sp. SO9]QQE77163.1 isochorismate synthase [Alicyclobacillus sp. SO9]